MAKEDDIFDLKWPDGFMIDGPGTLTVIGTKTGRFTSKKRTHVELCLACETTELDPNEAHNAYSRYCDAYICPGCGRKEALEGFFWTIRAKAAGVMIKPDQT